MASSEEEATTASIPEDDCLSVRKWWCFLLSSIFTFLAGLLVVLVWRACAFVCCRKEPELAPNDPKQKEQKAARQGKQEFEGTFMTEAKDWAGELISGQTTTGRILVSALTFLPSRVFIMIFTRTLRIRPIFFFNILKALNAIKAYSIDVNGVIIIQTHKVNCPFRSLYLRRQ